MNDIAFFVVQLGIFSWLVYLALSAQKRARFYLSQWRDIVENNKNTILGWTEAIILYNQLLESTKRLDEINDEILFEVGEARSNLERLKQNIENITVYDKKYVIAYLDTAIQKLDINKFAEELNELSADDLERIDDEKVPELPEAVSSTA